MSPTEKKINLSFDELDAAVERMRGPKATHLCRGCGCELTPGATCGSSCQTCSEHAAALYAQGAYQDRRVSFALVTGLVVGACGMLTVLVLCGWTP